MDHKLEQLMLRMKQTFLDLGLKVLTFDIETTYLVVRIWRLGDQVVRHEQLMEGFDSYNIMCLGYKWLHEDKVHVLTWDRDRQDCSKIIEDFDKVIADADIIVGQNSNGFDVKHINMQRLLHGLPALPKWTGVTFADTLKMARKYFSLPSNKLDYFSKALLGSGGKIKMEMQDWIDIVEHTKDEEKSWKKMLKYQKKDVTDTEKVFLAFASHAEPIVNASAVTGVLKGCRNCGSGNIKPNGSNCTSVGKFRKYKCNNCNKYAGRARINDSGIEAKRLS